MKTKQIKGLMEIMLISTTAKVLLNNPHVLLKMVSNMRPDLKKEVDKWKFLCRKSEMTEDLAFPLVKTGVIPFEYWDYVNNYWGNQPYCASDAFQSLLEANEVLLETFPPDQTLIFVKRVK